MAHEWLRLWHDMPNDPKWRTIARVSGQPIALVQALYLHLLVDASRNVTRGHVNVTTEDLASALDVTEEQIEAVMSAMNGRVMDGNVITGWEKRQPKREDSGYTSTEAKTPAERKRAQRQREADMRRVTQSHAESRDVTTDKDKDKDKKYPPLTPPSPGGDEGGCVADTPEAGSESLFPVESPVLSNRKKKNAAPPPPEPPGFVAFWQLWPRSDRKQARGQCCKAWLRVGAERDVSAVLRHVQHLAASDKWRERGGAFIPAPLTYLNQRRWDGAAVGESEFAGELGSYV